MRRISGKTFCRLSRQLSLAALFGSWLIIVAAPAGGEEATTAQPSTAATRAGAAAVQDFTEFLKAEAARAEAATKHESEAIENALKREGDAVEKSLTFFELVVGIAGTILVAGAGFLGWVLAAANRANKTDIQQEVSKQLPSKVAEEIETQFKNTLDRIARLENNVGEAERSLDRQRNAITDLVHWTMGTWPYRHLKSIHDKKVTNGTNEEFLFREDNAFKREMGYLIDNGYLENINLDCFKKGENMLDRLTITEIGRRYIEFRESLTPRPL